MSALKTIAGLFLLAAVPCGRAEEVYFGGHGDTNRHWTGYSVQVTPHGLTNWCAYTLSERGVIGKAPASSFSSGSNMWFMIFDEHVFTTNHVGTAAWFLPMYALTRHELRVVDVVPRTRINIVDGTNRVTLALISDDKLQQITQRGAPNQVPEVTPRKLGEPQH